MWFLKKIKSGAEHHIETVAAFGLLLLCQWWRVDVAPGHDDGQMASAARKQYIAHLRIDCKMAVPTIIKAD